MASCRMQRYPFKEILMCDTQSSMRPVLGERDITRVLPLGFLHRIHSSQKEATATAVSNVPLLEGIQKSSYSIL